MLQNFVNWNKMIYFLVYFLKMKSQFKLGLSWLGLETKYLACKAKLLTLPI